MYTPLSLPCSSLICIPPESMTEDMTWNVYPPKHSMLVSHFHTTWKYDRIYHLWQEMYTPLSIVCSSLIFTPPESMTEVMTINVYPPKHSMLDTHFHTTWKYTRPAAKEWNLAANWHPQDVTNVIPANAADAHDKLNSMNKDGDIEGLCTNALGMPSFHARHTFSHHLKVWQKSWQQMYTSLSIPCSTWKYDRSHDEKCIPP